MIAFCSLHSASLSLFSFQFGKFSLIHFIPPFLLFGRNILTLWSLTNDTQYSKYIFSPKWTEVLKLHTHSHFSFLLSLKFYNSSSLLSEKNFKWGKKRGKKKEVWEVVTNVQSLVWNKLQFTNDTKDHLHLALSFSASYSLFLSLSHTHFFLALFSTRSSHFISSQKVIVVLS